jgi:PTS system nitrogen regulatory IIA component
MPKLSRLIDAGHVALDLAASDVKELLYRLVQQLVVQDHLSEATGERLADALVRRELLGGTGIGNGVAVPHAYVGGVPQPAMLLARLHTPIAYGDPVDGKPVDLVILLTGPESIRPQHARVLARIVRLMRDEQWLAALRRAKSAEEVIQTIREVEERHA